MIKTKHWKLYLMAALYIGAGLMHFVITERYMEMMPPYFGHARFWVLFTGIAEVLGGIGLLIPATRRTAAWGIVLMLIGFFSVHIYMLSPAFLDSERGAGIPIWMLWVRLPLQVLFIYWAWKFTRKRRAKTTNQQVGNDMGTASQSPLMLLLLPYLLFASCKDNETEKTSITNQPIAKTATDNDTAEEYEEPGEDPAFTYPKTGSKAADFITEPDIYEIQLQAKGDLNGDGLEDIALVRKEEKNKYGTRPLLVLLQRKDKTYYLDKVSNLVMPIEYTADDWKIHDTEDLSIENGALTIHLYGLGPSGNLFSTFKYYGDELILTHIETYNMGVGSHQSLDYDLVKAEITETVMNTMKEDMPSESKTYKLKKTKHLFESTSPEDLVVEVYKEFHSEW